MISRRILPLGFLVAAALIQTASPADLPERVLLWPDGAPGSEGRTTAETVRVTDGGDRVVSGVHQPCVFPYLPNSALATGTAMVVIPGGGHRELWTTHEGHQLGNWLREHGIAAFVLHHRLAREQGSDYTVDDHALADARRAVQLVRSRTGEWGFRTNRIGVLGFSAGGELAALADMRPAATRPDADELLERISSKPDFIALIYPGSSRRFEVTAGSSPAFILCGYNDRPDISEGMAGLYLKYKAAQVPAELHIYARAGHGFGLRDTQKGAVAKWPDRLLDWLEDMQMSDRGAP